MVTKITSGLKKHLSKAKRNDGFTMIEIMIVVTIIAILSGVSISVYRNYLSKTKVETAKNQIRQFELPIQTLGQVPTTEEGIKKLLEEGLIKKNALNDPWGNPYMYRAPGSNGQPYEIWSWGADGKEGGEGFNKDIRSIDLE